MRAADLSRRAAVVGVAVIILAKLWLSHGEEICGSATRYDAFWFVNSAQHWYWGAEYSWTAFVRPPAYPLWLALVHELGIRQRLAIDLLQIAGFALLVLGLRRMGASRVLCLVAFAAACLHPGSYWQNNYTMADPFYAAMLPMAVGALLLVMATRRTSAAMAGGFVLAVLWFTREESVLIVALLATFAVIWLLHERSFTGEWRASLRRVVVPAFAVGGTMLVLILVVYAANRQRFRAFAKSEMSAPSYTAALDALVRIRPRNAQRFVPVTSESLELAFAASPTFARLKKQLDGDVGTGWRTETLRQQGVSGEIGINYLMWALRNAAAEAGIHSDARRAEKFYNRMAREINAACDEGRLPRRLVWASFIGPNLLPNLHRVPGSFASMLGVFVQKYETNPLQDDEILLPEERAVYDAITLRRPLHTVGPQHAPVATLVKNAIGSVHRWLVMACALIALVGVAALAWRGGLRLSDPLIVALLLLLAAISSRVALFTVIDATSWPVAYERFLFPVMPMTTVFLLAVIFHAAGKPRAASDAKRGPLAVGGG